MSLINTSVGPERVQAFPVPIGTVQVPGVATSVTAFLLSSNFNGAPVNVPTPVTDFDTFVNTFGNYTNIINNAYYSVEGFFNNAGTGNTAIIVNVGAGTAQIATVQTVADTGALETSNTTTVADSSGSLASTFFTFSDALDTHKYYVWYKVSSTGTDPAPVSRTGIEVDISTNDSANTVATATRTAIAAAAGQYVTVSGSTNHVIVTNKKMGNSTDAADGSAPTGFGFSTTVQGAASNLNSKYFTLNSTNNQHRFYVWFNVNSEGVDPLVANKSGIEIDIVAGSSDVTVATALLAAFTSSMDFTTSLLGHTVTFTNKTGGNCTAPADGTAATGFTFMTTTAGSAPTANDYIGDASAGTGLRALDTTDILGLVCAPGLPLGTAYLVNPAVIDYTKTVRTLFGESLSTSFSLLAIPTEITKSNSDTTVVAATTINTIVSNVLGVSASSNALLSVSPGMVLNKAGVYKATITAVNPSGQTVTVSTTSGLSTSDIVDLSLPSAIHYKANVVNDPSEAAGWYFNNVLMLSEDSTDAPGTLETVDPTGHVAGVIARIDANVSIGGPSHAPAGIQFAGLSGIQGLSLSLSERTDAGPLRLAFINRLTSFPNSGNMIFGAYTDAPSGSIASVQLVQVVRSLQFIKGSLERGLRAFIWENFSPDTQLQVQRAIESFLRNNSYLFPAGLPEAQQFKVIQVATTQSDLDAGVLRVRVQVKPNTAVRFIEIALEFPLPTA